MLYYIMKTVVHTCCLLSFFYFPSPSYDEIPRLSWFPNKYAVPFRPMHAAICVQCRAMHHDDFLPRTSDRPGYSLAHRGRTLHNLFVRRAATGAFPLRCGFHLKPGDQSARFTTSSKVRRRSYYLLSFTHYCQQYAARSQLLHFALYAVSYLLLGKGRLLI